VGSAWSCPRSSIMSGTVSRLCVMWQQKSSYLKGIEGVLS
jgi:hypothetical protein